MRRKALTPGRLVQIPPVRSHADIGHQRNLQLDDMFQLVLDKLPNLIDLSLRHIEQQLMRSPGRGAGRRPRS